MAKRATIRDVAKIAGVSTATVSRALNDPDYPIGQETMRKILEAVKQTGYVANVAARALRSDICRDVGLVIPNLSNPFYLQTTLGITEVLSSSKYNLVFFNTMRNTELEHQYLHQLYERNIRDVILSSVDENADMVKEYSQKGMRFVLLDQKLSGLDCTGINFDSRAGARIATEHLAALGHTRIAFATLPMNRWTRQEMHSGYKDALAVAGISYNSALVYEQMPDNVPPYGEFELEVGRSIATSFIEDGCPATAIICINDMLAIGLIKALQQSGIRVPEDVSIFGFDDIPFAAAFSPALSTVHYSAMEAGRLAAMMLLENMNKGKLELSLSMQLSPTLVIRDTVAPPKK